MTDSHRSQRTDNSAGTPEQSSHSSSTISTPVSSCKRKNVTDSDPSNKRLKSAPAQPMYTKHPRFWVLDGNVLLQISSTRFKLHRSRLASQSTWFEKLFERRPGRKEKMKTEEDVDDDSADINDIRTEEADGYDLYYLDSTGIVVKDFETLLTAMDDCIDYYFDEPNFLVVAAIFRAASLFRFQKMVDFARTFLNEQFSNKLSLMDEETLPHGAEAVLLGRGWNLGTILKRAFYELARRDSLCSTGDSSNASESGDDDDMDGDNEDDEDAIHQLDPKDLIRLANGQKKLMSAWLTAVQLSDVKCALKTPCNSNKARMLWGIISPHLTEYQFDPICGIGYLMNSVEWKTMGYCAQCADARIASLKKQREEIWENMSLWFDLK